MKTKICNRRRFLKQTALMAGGLAAFPALARADTGVNDEVRVAIIGLGNKGGQHVQLFSALSSVRLAALCEVDPIRLAPQVEKLKQKGVTPFTTSDPRRILSLGGRFTYDDAAQTPNTQFTLAEYPALPIVIENRNRSMEKDAVVMVNLRRVQEGFVLQYEGGYFAGFRMGGSVFDNAGKTLQRFQGNNGEDHQANFVKALRSRKAEDLHAPIGEGHVSSAVCRLGNISYRLGRPGNLRACENALGNRPPVAEGFPRLVKSLEGIGVDLDKTPFTLGPPLQIDPASGNILQAGAGDAGQLEQVRRLARGTHRAPFVLPT